MFRDKDEAQSMIKHTSSDNVTVLKEDATFEGKLIFEGHVLVNGKYKGQIQSAGELTIGRTGVVEGEVEIGTIVVHGEVNGNINASQKIVINAPAVVRGDIIAPSLIIEEGAVFEGNCTMGTAKGHQVVNKDKTSKQSANDNEVFEFNKTADMDL